MAAKAPTSTDATPRADETEAALRQSEERFRAFVLASSDVVYRMSPDWSEMRQLRGRGFINDTLEPSRTWLREYIHPDDQAHVMAVIAEAIRSKTVFELEHRVLRVDGTLGWTFSRAIPILDVNGEIVEWFGAASDVTRRKQAEEELRRGEERLKEYAELLEHAPVLVRDPDDRIAVWNEGMEALYGWRRDEAIGHVSHELLRTRFPQPLAEIRAALERTGRWDGELHHFRRDGTEVVVASQWILHRDHEGQARAIVEMNTDITGRRRAEAALLEHEERLRLFVEYAPAGIAMLDRDMRYLAVSRRFMSDYRIPAQDLVGRSHYEVFPDIPERWREIHRRCLAGAVGRSEEDPFPRADGTLDWVRWEIRPWRTSAGEIGGLILFSELVTERKRQLEALRASEERFRLLVQGVKDYAIYMLAPDGTVKSWSAAAEQIFGYREEEIVGQHRRVFFTAEAREAGTAELDLETALRDGRHHEEGWRIRKDGSRFFADVLITALRDDTGLLRGFANVTRDVTDRRASEAALRESEGKYVAIHDKAPFGIALMKLPELTFVTANDTFLRTIGFTREEVIGRTGPELGISDPDSQAQALREFEQRGSLRDFEVIRRTKSGSRIVLSTSMERVTIDGTEFILATGQDITDRKRAQEELRASEQRLRLAQEAARIGAFEWDIQANVNTWTPELEAIYGLPRGGFQGTEAAWEELVHPDDRAEALQRVRQAFESGAPTEGEWRAVWPDGSIHWIAGRWQVLKDGSGQPLRMTGVNMDITARKRAEEELRASEERLRLAQQVARVGTFEWDIRTGVNTWSPELEAMYGLPRGGFPRTQPAWENLVHPDDRAAAVRAVEQAFDARAPVEGEWRVVWPDGSVHWLAGRFQVFRDDAGTPLRMTGINIDITERKRAEVLRASEAALREADRQKDQFLAMLSHELRNPLAPIRNSLYILDHASPGGERARRAQSVLHRQVAQMTWLIDDLLDVTRITHGKIELQRERLDLNDVARRVAEDQRTVFVKSEVQLEVLPAAEEVWIDGDRVRLAQVLGNLLQNAAKFTPRGGKTTVSIRADGEGAQAILTVTDTGRGIAADMLPRLFHAFSQAESTLDRSKGGLGLGLALVKGLVELHGGAVSAASGGLGKGAAFTIRLPLDVLAARSAPARGRVAGDGARRRVLVIEDNKDAADTLSDVLQLEDHVVEVAYSGREGIEKARLFHPDAVLCDIGLPEMDGYAVARAMRADPELRHVTLVAVSGYAQPEDVAMAKESGFDAHLAKPPSVEKLKLALEEAGAARAVAGSTAAEQRIATAPAAARKGLMVLVTDDDADIRDGLSDVLEEFGHSVATAAHGREALDYIAAGNWPCAILLDWLMPTMGGDEFLEERERSPALRDIPVFVISGTHVPTSDARIAGWLTKPFDVPALVALLGRACSEHCRREQCPFDKLGPRGGAGLSAGHH